MRSDGRLKLSKFLSFDVRYPVILLRKCWLTKLIVKEFHEKGKQASGINHTLAELSARYWIISGPEAIRKRKKRMHGVSTKKSKSCRLVMHVPFTLVKTKYMYMTESFYQLEHPWISEACAGTKKTTRTTIFMFLHLHDHQSSTFEIAFGLDTESFLNAFYKMASHRGVPEELFSDSGTFFKAQIKSSNH